MFKAGQPLGGWKEPLPDTADPTKRVCLEMAKLLGIIYIYLYHVFIYIAYDYIITHCNGIK